MNDRNKSDYQLIDLFEKKLWANYTQLALRRLHVRTIPEIYLSPVFTALLTSTTYLLESKKCKRACYQRSRPFGDFQLDPNRQDLAQHALGKTR